VILEALTGLDRTWDDIHHRSYFLLDLRRIEAGEFVLTMTGDRSCPINPLAMHTVYIEGNMVSINEMIPIDISRTPDMMENVSSERTDPPKRFEFIRSYLKNSTTFLPGLTRKFQA
jgi:hypothetical protein